MLEAIDLRKSFRDRDVVRGATIKIAQGEVVGLLGPNGAGKTTCFYMIVGLIKTDSGQIRLNGKSLTNLTIDRRAKFGLGYLPQDSSIFKKMSVEQNLLAILQIRKDLSIREQKFKLDKLLEEFNLTHIRKNKGMSLSGGERRRTEIARALASSPKFLLLDEPFAGIDPIAIEEVKSTISMLKNMNIGIIITDHNVKEALSIVEFGYIIYNGQIIKSGSPKEIISDKFVKKIYLGKNYN